MFILRSEERQDYSTGGRKTVGKKRSYNEAFLPKKLSKIIHLQPQQYVKPAEVEIEKVRAEEIKKAPQYFTGEQIYDISEDNVRNPEQKKYQDKRVAMPLDELKMTILQELRVEHEISIDAFVEYYR